MSFTLSIEGDEAPYRGQALDELLAQVATEQKDFLILTRDATEEYIQAAGAHARLTVERRDRVEGSWLHVKLARRDAASDRLPPRVPGYAGFEQRELFEVKDAAQLFSDFIAGVPLSAGVIALDMDESAESPEPEPEPESGGWLGRLFKRR